MLKKYFRKGVKVTNKPDKSPVTIADKECERKIVSTIKKHFPDHNILGEEFSYKETDSEFKWIIDPLDMTSNFVRGIPFYSNFVALERNGKVIAGVINMPELDLFAYAGAGKGAFVNNKRVHVSRTKKLYDAYILHGSTNRKATRPYSKRISNLIDQCHFNRGYGDGLGYILLAKGNVDILLDRGKPWDLAPGKIIIEEAGGKVTDFNGKEGIYGKPCVVATNGLLHKSALKILK